MLKSLLILSLLALNGCAISPDSIKEVNNNIKINLANKNINNYKVFKVSDRVSVYLFPKINKDLLIMEHRLYIEFIEYDELKSEPIIAQYNINGDAVGVRKFKRYTTHSRTIVDIASIDLIDDINISIIYNDVNVETFILPKQYAAGYMEFLLNENLTYPEFNITKQFDTFKNQTHFKSMKYAGPNYSFLLRATKTENITINKQIYIIFKYSGGWKFYSSATDANGNELELTKIDKSVITCINGCKYREAVGVSLPTSPTFRIYDKYNQYVEITISKSILKVFKDI